MSSSNPPEPIAIVGMGMRLPGGVGNEEDFWDLLINKRDGRCEVPADRYNIDSFHNPSKSGFIASRYGHFLQGDPSQFDNAFFSIGNLEASSMDPQQRALLEVIWECMENAGQVGWRGTRIGCYVGVFGEDWLDMSSKDPQATDWLHVLGTGDFVLSNRISYDFDLQGPSITFKTACSSSLVGLHYACQGIFNGDCDSAIVAGTNMILSPTMTTAMSDNMVMSPNGVCKTFDATADGYSRGEAANAIFIKRLDDALRDGDCIRAVIRATSTNCDGRTPSITTPGSRTQEALIRSAYSKARIEAIGSTAYFECHGTGTVVGDAAETSVVGKIFGQEGIFIGSVKPNVGHSEGASGLTSVLKSVLALEHRVIPPNINFSTPSPNLRLDEYKLVVPTECVPWPSDRLERVSVNCFGIGGSNTHVILDSGASVASNVERCTERTQQQPNLAVISAMSNNSMERQIDSLIEFINNREPNIADLVYTLGERREKLNRRAFCVIDTNRPITAEMFHKSDCTLSGVSFVFTGQGAQWAGMGEDMGDDMLSTIRELDQVLAGLEDAPAWSIENELRTGVRVDDPEFSQPLCTALQVGVVNLLRSWDIQPLSVVGHSSGEIAAAYAAGAISAETAIILAYYRGKMVKTFAKPGRMTAVGLSESTMGEYLEDGVEIACINSPESVTLSGDADILQGVIDAILEKVPDTFHRMLPVDVAYHSSYMEETAAKYEECISAHIQTQETMIQMYSTVEAKVITSPAHLDAAYWSRNLRNPVQFSPAVESLLKESKEDGVIVEVGPHSALASAVRHITQRASGIKSFDYIPTLIRGSPLRRCLLATAGHLHIRSVPVNLTAINGPGKLLTNLPPYPWQRNGRLWREPRLAQSWRFREHPHHELLGARCLESSTLEPAWRNLLRPERVSWLWQHKLQNKVVFPCAAFVAMIGEAIRQHTSNETYSIENLILKSPLILDEVEAIELLTSFHPERLSNTADSGWYLFTISSCHDGTWVKHCTGKAMPGSNRPEDTPVESTALLRQVSSEVWYQALRKQGLDYGPEFKGLTDITACPATNRSAATFSDDRSRHESRYSVHPIVLDQALQATGVAFCNGLPYNREGYGIPASIGRLYVRRGEPDMRASASCQVQGATYQGSVSASIGNEVAFYINDVFFFALDTGARYAEMIPLASVLEWRPDMEMLPPASLLEPASTTNSEALIISESLSMLCTIQTAGLISSLPTPSPYLNKYKSWVGERLAKIRAMEDERYPDVKEWLTISSSARNILIDSTHNEILSSYPDVIPFANATRKVVDNCADFMTGDKSPLDVLMEGNSLEDIYKVQAEWSDWSRFFPLLGHSNPTLRVLEIGAGTGGTTSKVLNLLKSSGSGTRLYSNYTFTDISSGFLLAAKQRFQDVPGIEYRTLDISQSPLEQGFESGKYDLIIASNVFHATESILAALVNVRGLLSPDGYLFLQELCPEAKCINYVMGVLPGWWLGESDGRAKEPYIPPPEWDKKLVDAGLTGIEAMNYDHMPPYQLSATILTRRARPVTSPGGTINLLHDRKPCQTAHQIADHLRGAGYHVEWRGLDEPISSPSIGANTVLSLLDLEEPYLATMSSKQYVRLHHFLNHSKDTRIIWITHPVQFECRDPRFGLVLGFARTIRYEMGIDFATVEVADPGVSWQLSSLQHLASIMRKSEESYVGSVNDTQEYEYVIHNGRVFVGRFDWTHMSSVLSDSSPTGSPDDTLALNIRHYGVLDTIEWTPVTVPPLAEGEVEVEIHQVGLNFRDVMVSLGVMGNKDELGVEAVGVICRTSKDVHHLQVGTRVFVVATGLFCERKVTAARNCKALPYGMSAEEAAAMMPTVFFTAIHSLIDVGQVEEGQSVLIHSACGGVGIAAIQICQLKKAVIYVTVGSQEKAQFLKNEYGIPAHRIFNSRDASFVRDIQRETQGRGVDIVLNSLSGELLQASWNCVAKFGKMLELGKRDFIGQAVLNMENFAANRSFIGVDLLQVGQECPEKFDRLFDKMEILYKSGHIYPLRPVKMFDAADIVQAFRYMQPGTHKGKIIVNMKSDIPLGGAESAPPLSFCPDKAYLLVGGLGGVGRVVANWMVGRGARNLAFLSRSTGKTGSDQAFFEELRVQGCQVTPLAGDAADMDDVQRALSAISTPLAGILQMSMVLRDQSFPKMSYNEWTAPMVSKVDATWTLHQALENTPLDFFVVFSSIVGLGGNIGQANYTAANTFVDAFVSYRRSRGLPASVLNLGIMDAVGATARDSGLLDWVKAGSMRCVTELELLEGLEATIRRSQVDLSPKTGTDWSLGFSHLLPIGFSNTKPLSDSGVRPLWNPDARFRLYANVEAGANHASESSSGTIRELLLQLEANPQILDHPDTEKVIEQELVKLICSHMPGEEGRAPESIAIDSLMTIEIRNWFRRNLALEVGLVEISNAGTIGGLVKVTSRVLREKYRTGKEE